MVIDGYIAPEDSVANDLHGGKPSSNMVLSVVQKHLSGFKGLHRHDCLMLVGVEVLVTVLSITLMLMLVQIRSKGFPGQHATAVPFVSQYVVDGPLVPFNASGLGRAFNVCEKLCYFSRGFARQEGIKNEPDDCSFRFYDLQKCVFDVVANRIPGTLIPQ